MTILRTTTKMMPRLVAVALLTVFTACTTGQPRPARIERALVEPDESGRIVYMEDVESAKRTVISRNYAVGARRVAAVGEPIVGVRNYTATSAVVGAVALEHFRQLCSLPPGYGYPDVHGAGYPAAPEGMSSARIGVSLLPSTGHDPAPYGYRGPGAAEQAGRSASSATTSRRGSSRRSTRTSARARVRLAITSCAGFAPSNGPSIPRTAPPAPSTSSRRPSSDMPWFCRRSRSKPRPSVLQPR